MAVISTEKQYIDGVYFTRTVRCDRKGEFSCILPPFVAKVVGKSQITARTLAEIDSAWRQALGDYRDSRIIERKVIALDIAMVCDLVIDGEHYHRNDISFSKGQALEIVVGVFTETRATLQNGGTTTQYQALASGIPFRYYPEARELGFRRYVIWDWTEDREKFFVGLTQAFDALLGRVIATVRDTDKFLNLIDSGIKNLLPAPAGTSEQDKKD